MSRIKVLGVLASLLLAAGCASTDTQEVPEDSRETVGTETGREAGGVGQPERMSIDERLQDPADPLSQRVVYFEFDRSDIPREELATLDAHARFLVENPNVRIRLEGHADERGSREYNIGLGDRRAQAVRRILLFQGVSADQITTVSYGEERPAVQGQGPEVWAKNRRVEIIYLR
ncbi:MAG TPA: peptidoglycan-associated lipoprotein Pal [Gammaproteobacteria bacterium]|nr:peptidoglycan-associated lipoprotein Pal [Gammaproteobacteria bacterium]